MGNVLRCALSVAALACYSAAAARADVICVATVVAENQADFASNAALMPTFVGLLKKGAGDQGDVFGHRRRQTDDRYDLCLGRKSRHQVGDGYRRLESRGGQAEIQDLYRRDPSGRPLIGLPDRGQKLPRSGGTVMTPCPGCSGGRRHPPRRSATIQETRPERDLVAERRCRGQFDLGRPQQVGCRRTRLFGSTFRGGQGGEAPT